ncbi:helix-turn-helix domain-containing protein [Leucobacter aridicollis]|uniref:Transcriptional regulator with XRE-family HTH domain n=1 Tax=Leucobacter aridicollis TaxID=283878 RepID=A0A852R4Z8_9MICO|nr:helix-turn-helix transcriptional regulator [Leucobacter aridicollis]MBL3682609.1 XRE family transcriptional regulator [Leucobacter aridicollis]NYD26028.1 transcriptional regulator with XRE-family HTH domain [Leucobacter aridicollis]
MSTRNINGPAVAVIRELMGMRKGEFARRVEIDPGYLTKIEAGSRQPSPAVMKRIAFALGVSIEVVTYPVNAEAAA